jgi:hypothetical protein
MQIAIGQNELQRLRTEIKVELQARRIQVWMDTHTKHVHIHFFAFVWLAYCVASPLSPLPTQVVEATQALQLDRQARRAAAKAGRPCFHAPCLFFGCLVCPACRACCVCFACLVCFCLVVWVLVVYIVNIVLTIVFEPLSTCPSVQTKWPRRAWGWRRGANTRSNRCCACKPSST